MIDIHSHIIFGVDDGPKTMDMSLALIEEAYRQGVRILVATSHRRKGMFETPEKIIKEHFIQLREIVKDIYPDLTLCYGGELYYTKDMLEKLEKKAVPTLNGTCHILLEFSKNTPWKEIQIAVNEVSLLGLSPLLAHVERYDALAFNKDRVEELIRKGCYMQVNSSHVLQPKLIGDRASKLKKRVKFLLKKDLVHCIASDVHNMTSRASYMKEAYQRIAQTFGSGRAQKLFVQNPLQLLKK